MANDNTHWAKVSQVVYIYLWLISRETVSLFVHKDRRRKIARRKKQTRVAFPPEAALPHIPGGESLHSFGKLTVI